MPLCSRKEYSFNKVNSLRKGPSWLIYFCTIILFAILKIIDVMNIKNSSSCVIIENKSSTDNELSRKIKIETSNTNLIYDESSMPESSEVSIGTLMLNSGTDKLNRHAYDRYYELYLERFRHLPNVFLLEIGAGWDGQSLPVWANYFSSPGGIHSIAYRTSPHPENAACNAQPKLCQKINVFEGDQSDVEFLSGIRSK